jgi:hypothetical protein
MKTATPTIALVAALGLMLTSCGDQFSTSGQDDDDSSLDDDDADDDTAGDDDSWDGPSPSDVQAALDAVGSWPTIDGCEDVVIFATNAGAAVELNFSASVDFSQIEPGGSEDEQYDLAVPGSGAVLSVKAGSNLGSTQCTQNPGTPDITDNYSVESGVVTLTVTRVGGGVFTASLAFSGLELKRVGGDEMVTIPDVTLPQIPLSN